MKTIASLILVLLAVLLFPRILRAQSPAPADLPATCYLFSYFINDRDGLHLAWSKDGLKWQAFMQDGQEKIFVKPTLGDNLLRDPCILLGPDKVFHLVFGVSHGNIGVGYASSKDLLHWSEPQLIPVMKDEPTARNVWAAEVHYDAATKRYLIFWSSTIPGRFPETDHSSESDFNHRTYLTTTQDFVTYTPTALWFNPKFSEIDATVISFKHLFYLIFKNETRFPDPAKDLYLATSDKMAGPYTNVTGPIATTPPQWVEGPTAIQIGNKVILYYDCYFAGHFGACKSTDMQRWTDITDQISLPKGIRHGTVLAVPGSVISHVLRTLGK